MKRVFSMGPAWLAVSAAALLSACGGGGGGTPVVQTMPGTEVPVAATTSPTEAIKFVQGVASQPKDQAEPISVDGVTLATSETEEPV